MKKRGIYMISAAALTALFHLLAPHRPLMTAVASFTLCIRQALARFFSPLPFSAAEALICAALLFLFIYIICALVSFVRGCGRRRRILLGRLSFLIAAAETVYLLLCLFLGASYYAESFQAKSGLRPAPSTVGELYAVTDYFAGKLGETYMLVPRDENGLFAASLDGIFASAPDIYRGAEEEYAFLALKDVPPKRVLFSRLMSRFNYTGFYFPFTGEANINTDAPACLIPSTIAHEMAHQRGVASEQDANFCAVLACTLSGDPVYEYSGWLMGYIHLCSALYGYDRDGYREICSSLPEPVLADLRANNAYWKAFETRSAEISGRIYDAFLKSYGQELGVHSYGAVVDLLIARYLPVLRTGEAQNVPGEGLSSASQ